MAGSRWKRIAAMAAMSISFGGSQRPCAGVDAHPNSHPTEAVFQGASDSAQTGWLFVPYAQFKIPFNIESGGAAPAQVQLWVSTDSGSNWQLHSSLGAEKRNFEFRAAGEGAYLFAVQTRDAIGAAFPSTQPPMRVIVDTTRPEATLQADVDSSGRLIAHFEIVEQHLDADSLRLEFRTDRETNWQAAMVDGLHRSGQALRGHAIVSPAQCREVMFRLVVKDLAQNKCEATVNYSMPRTAAAAAAMQLAKTRGEPSQPGRVPAGASVARTETASPFGTGPSRNAPSTTPGLPTLPTPGGSVWSSDHQPPPSSAQAGHTLDKQAAGQKPELASLQGWTDARKSTDRPESQTVRVGPSKSPATNASTTAPMNQPATALLTSNNSAIDREGIEIQPAPGKGALPISPTPGPEELPAPPAADDSQRDLSLESGSIAASEKPVATGSNMGATDGGSKQARAAEAPEDSKPMAGGTPSSLQSQTFHSRSRAFSLDYSVDSLKGSQIADVELWGTEDGGRTWTQWGVDPDRESPFDVQVADDGLFGFRMVVVGGNGLVSGRPKDGDDADAWINVDSVAPAVKITRAVYGEGPEAGMLVIDYKCEDANLHDRPVTLSFGEHPNGPWTTIASGLRNTGVYLWKAGTNLPKKVYLRIEATDRGGNVATHRLDLPISIEGLAPRGRIQGFRPLERQ